MLRVPGGAVAGNVMPQKNRFTEQIKGGHARHPRWFGHVAPTMHDNSLRVWIALLERYDLPATPGVVSIGVRSLAAHVGRSIGAVQNAIDDLERRGLITSLPPGPYGRRRWTMAIAEEPQAAREKPATKRGEHAARQERQPNGKFGPIR